jgi:hypothetical protein
MSVALRSDLLLALRQLGAAVGLVVLGGSAFATLDRSAIAGPAPETCSVEAPGLACPFLLRRTEHRTRPNVPDLFLPTGTKAAAD